LETGLGAALSVVPTTVLRKLGVKPHSERSLILVDGTEIKRRVGDVMFHYDGQRGASPVIFGEEGDSVLLGVVSLEALGLIFDPLRRELRPMPMVLGGHGSRRPADLTCAAAERAAFSATAS
jgi:predicted aspartyl protease